MRRMTMILLSCALASAPAIGCGGRSAELTRDDGAVVIGPIVGADETRIWVDSVEPRRRVVVQRDRLIDIDHPSEDIMWGSVSMGVGALFMLPLVLVLADDDDAQSSAGPAFGPRPEGIALLFALSGAALLAIGIPTLVVGIGDKAASEAAASPEAGPPAEPAATVQVGLTGLRITF